MSGHASGGAWALERVCCIKQEEGENSNRTTRGAQEQCNAGNIYMSHARCVFHKLWEGALLVPGWSEVHGGKIKKKSVATTEQYKTPKSWTLGSKDPSANMDYCASSRTRSREVYAHIYMYLNIFPYSKSILYLCFNAQIIYFGVWIIITFILQKSLLMMLN